MVSAQNEADEKFREIYPFKSNFHAAAGGAKQHYVDEGEGEPIVMVHGNPTWSFFYRRLISEFSKTHRAIAPDHIGCGFSDKPQDYPYTLKTHIDNLESLLQSLDLPPINLIVHDWGGAIGMGYAVRHPEKVKRIIILNTAAFMFRKLPLRIAICRIPLFGEIAVRGFNGFAAGAIYMAPNKHDRMTPQIKAGFLKPYDSWANRIATHKFVLDIPMTDDAPAAAPIHDMESKLSLFADTPMLIQWGAKDWCFDMDFFAEWQKRFPNAESDVYQDAGHYLLEDAHEKIIPRIKAFLEK